MAGQEVVDPSGLIDNDPDRSIVAKSDDRRRRVRKGRKVGQEYCWMDLSCDLVARFSGRQWNKDRENYSALKQRNWAMVILP